MKTFKILIQRFLPEELIRFLQTAYWAARLYLTYQEFSS